MTRKAKRRFERRELDIPFKRPEEYDEALLAVVGQDVLKIKLKSAFSQYTAYLQDESAGRPVILVYGETGSGKTFAIEQLARATGLPLTIVSAPALSPPSYKGVTMQDAFVRHWMQHHTDRGIMFVDEINKWCVTSMTRGDKGRAGAEDIGNGIRSQHELLRYVEMDRINFVDTAKDFPELADVEFNTKNLLWVFGGAFLELPKIIKGRLAHGYMPEEELWAHALPADFIKYGMVEEFAMRIQTYAWTLPLDGMQLVEILNAQELPKWQKRFAQIGCELEIQPGAVGLIAHRAFKEHIGARGALSLMRRSMDDVFYHVSRQHRTRFTVDADMIVTGQVQPEIGIADAV
jgi:ATP-dependent Clp protease ATP-binding subunit ClpX